ncbi:hypothetical protein [Estrella lausannensis]|nr:hypothetical protein [Estrella lausannensis]
MHSVTAAIPGFLPSYPQNLHLQSQDPVLPAGLVGREMTVPRDALFQQSEEVSVFFKPLTEQQPEWKGEGQFEEVSTGGVARGLEAPKRGKLSSSPDEMGRKIIGVNDDQRLPFVGRERPFSTIMLEELGEEEEPVSIEEEMKQPHFPLTPGEEPYLVPLAADYQEIEAPKIRFQGKDVHFYPTDTVLKVHKQFLKARGSDLNLTFETFVNRQEIAKRLKITEDTTQYLPEKFLVQNKMAHIFNQQITRGEQQEPLNVKAKHIFVVDAKGRLMIATKHRSGKRGRTQHSSLAQGAAVRAAGIMSLQDGGVYRFENLSGHYRSGRDSLTEVAYWITRQGFKYQVVRDDVYMHPDAGLTRLLDLKLV